MSTILILEDSRELNKALALRLQHAGYTVHRAFDAAQATTLARQHGPTLALLDISVPAGDGFMVADRIAEFGNPKVVFITANKDPELRARVRRSGAGFMYKPFTAVDLLQRVEEMIPGASASAH
ncbi:MAG: response regulator [Pseudomonadota bacterium]